MSGDIESGYCQPSWVHIKTTYDAPLVISSQATASHRGCTSKQLMMHPVFLYINERLYIFIDGSMGWIISWSVATRTTRASLRLICLLGPPCPSVVSTSRRSLSLPLSQGIFTDDADGDAEAQDEAQIRLLLGFVIRVVSFGDNAA